MPRTLVPGPTSPHAVVDTLPGLYQDDEFMGRFLEALDETLAPVFAILDGGFEAHLDPALVPADFMPWLASWLGLALEDGWGESRQRELIANAVELYRWRGTIRGLADAISVFVGEIPEILESGGVAWSTTPGAEIPGVAPPQIVVRVALPDGDSAALGRVERLVALAKPAHIAHRVELV